jgi:hypothetical protein
MILNSSPKMCVTLPAPAAAMLIFPGLAFAKAMNSGTVLAETEGPTSITAGTSVALATGAISRMKL